MYQDDEYGTPVQADADSRISEDDYGHFIIYCAICLVNGKKYIGYTGQGLQERKRRHEWAANRDQPGDNSIFHKALRKYGFHEFCWKEIASCNSETEAREMESHCIKIKYKSFPPNGYNTEIDPSTSKINPRLL